MSIRRKWSGKSHPWKPAPKKVKAQLDAMGRFYGVLAYRWTLEDLERVTAKPKEGLDAFMTPIVTKKPAKFRNVKVTDESGVVHDSTKQYRRWLDLELRQRAGEISQLHREPVFDLIVNGVLVCKYIADASYVENATGEKVVEDTKSEITRKNRVYRLKAKLMRACHGIEVRET